MKQEELCALTEMIVREYYKNNLKPFFAHLDEKVLWYGPAKGQFISGREAMLKAWANENHGLTFRLGNIRIDYVSVNTVCFEVLMSFPVTTVFPTGECITMDQIIHITWCERRDRDSGEKVPRMLVIHISDLYRSHESDNIYPVHFNEVYKGFITITDSGKRIYFKGMDSKAVYLFADSIVWAETNSSGRHSVIHTTDDAIRVCPSLEKLVNEHSKVFIRCHLRFLVNPRHITRIYRFRAVMSDGTELPIPEKKYTAFKRAVKEFMDKLDTSKDENLM